jgi:tRNA threonylcarbamoyladenosine biosynthesis protein TsaE
MEFIIESLENINEVAKAFLDKYSGNKVIAMYGDMGVGKTTFVKAVCRTLGMEDEASSPSFSIVNEYRGENKTIYHFDFYRINEPEEAYDFGYEEYFYSGNMCFVEWPEKIDSLMPEDALVMKFTEREDGVRIIDVEAV